MLQLQPIARSRRDARAILAIALALAFCRVAGADTPFRVQAQRNGVAVIGATACFSGAIGNESFADRFLSATAVNCYPADHPILLGSGFWNYHVEADGLVSADPLATHIAATSQNPLSTMSVELIPAGTVELENARQTLQDGESLAFYITNEGRPHARPNVQVIADDARRVLIPADMRVVLLIVRDRTIVWSWPPVTVASGHVIHMPTAERLRKNVVAVVTLSRNMSPEDRQAIDPAAPPEVRLVGAAGNRSPAFPLRPAPLCDMSLVIFEDVPPGQYSAEIGGGCWTADRTSIVVSGGANVSAQSAKELVTQPQCRLEVTWRIDGAMASESVDPTCAQRREAAHARLTLSHCRYEKGHSDPSECNAVRSAELAGTAGTASFHNLLGGEYDVILFRSGARAVAQIALGATPTSKTALVLDPEIVTGKVTRGGKPVSALVTFASGTTVSNGDTGEFRCFVSDSPGQRAVWVTPCDTERTYIEIPAKPVNAGDRYDIAISENRLTIRIEDEHGDAVADAAVTERIVTTNNTLARHTVGVTDDSGTVVDVGLARDQTFEICAMRRGYTTTCIDDVLMKTNDETRALRLRKPSGRQVRIVSEQPLGRAEVLVVSGSRIIDDVSVDADGTFRLTAQPATNSVLYVFADHYPLTRLPVPDLTPDEPLLPLPVIPSRSFAVTLPEASAHRGGPFDVELGGVVVPLDVFSHYQATRHLAAQIRSGETVQIAPVNGSEPVAFLLWRWVKDLPRDAVVADPFGNPEALRLMHRETLTASQVVLTP